MLLAPIYALAGYTGVVLVLIAMARWPPRLRGDGRSSTLNAPGAATFAWAAIACSAPFLFNTFTVYPEIAAALAVMIALYDAGQPDRRRALRLRRRVAAVAEHEVRADVGRPAPRRVSVSGNGPCHVALPSTVALAEAGGAVCGVCSRLVRIFLCRSGARRCRWRPTARWCRPRR